MWDSNTVAAWAGSLQRCKPHNLAHAMVWLHKAAKVAPKTASWHLCNAGNAAGYICPTQDEINKS